HEPVPAASRTRGWRRRQRWRRAWRLPLCSVINYFTLLTGLGCIPTFLYMGAASGDDMYFTRARAAAAFFACDDTNALSDVGVAMDAGSGPTASTPGSVRISLTNVSPISTSPFASASIAAAPPRAR